jgi:hypothetical protein
MKKFAICCAVLVFAAMFVPGAQAAQKCYHLTNFCDGLQFGNVFVGNVQGTEAVGLWDWRCFANGTGTLVAGPPGKVGTQPLYPYSGGTGGGFSANFAFRASTLTFDLNATFDGFTVTTFQTNQPYTTTKGVCNPLHANVGLRTTTGR